MAIIRAMKRPAVSLALSRRHRPDEVLLVERSKKLRAFAGVLAFPGGTLDAADAEVEVRGLDDGEMAPVFAAGTRELFEETGIWLGRGERSPSVEALRTARRRLLDEDTTLPALLSSFGHHLDARDLAPFCKMTTPPFAPRRFETWFLRGLLPEDAEVEIWEGELVAGDFEDPVRALQGWREGELRLAPPMVVLLEEWTRGQDGLEARVRELTESYDRGALHRVYFSPGILLVPLETPTRPPATHTNTCIVGEERLYLVDPSPRDASEQARLWALLDELIDEGRKLEGILLTHYHPDHVGALEEMQERYGVPAHAHADCMAELPGARFADPVEHEDAFTLGRSPDGRDDWTLTAYHVPGHARGHLAFQESRYGAAIVGDLVSTLSSILVDPSDGHLKTYLESLEFLEGRARGPLYPGHGPPAQDGRVVIRKTLEHRAEREEQLVSALSADPQSVAELVERIYTDVPREAHALAARSLLSGLVKLEEDGVVRRVDEAYALVRA